MCQYFIPLYCWTLFCCIDLGHFVYPFLSGYIIWVASTFFVYYEWCCYEYLCASFSVNIFFSVLLDIYLGVEFLGHWVSLCLTFWVITKLFQSSCTILHSHQQCMRALILPHLCQHLLLFMFLMIVILVYVKWCLICDFYWLLIDKSINSFKIIHFGICMEAFPSQIYSQIDKVP